MVRHGMVRHGMLRQQGIKHPKQGILAGRAFIIVGKAGLQHPWWGMAV